jgi:hypothetical protein
MIYTIIPIVVLLWLISGQMIKGLRRYAIPLLATLYVAFLKDRKKRWLAGLMLIFSGILSLGYGENSHIRKFVGGSDFWTRIVMSLLIASVPITYGLISHGFSIFQPMIVLVNIAAWQVHAGSLGRIGKYDILIEDICRSTALGVSIVIM